MSDCRFFVEGSPEEVPMNRYTNPIPVCQCRQMNGCSGQQEELDHILTALAYQNQLLIDLLAAVNGLTAALLSIRK